MKNDNLTYTVLLLDKNNVILFKYEFEINQNS